MASTDAVTPSTQADTVSPDLLEPVAAKSDNSWPWYVWAIIIAIVLIALFYVVRAILVYEIVSSVLQPR